MLFRVTLAARMGWTLATVNSLSLAELLVWGKYFKMQADSHG